MSVYENIRPTLRKKGPISFLLAYSAFILWASLREGGTGVSIQNFDKVLHFSIYGLLAAIACWVWPKMDGWKIWLGVAACGGLMEVCQGYFTQGRVPSLADALANAIGAAIAIMLYRYWLIGRLSKAQ